ncbi:MAG: type II toxin-antitoxin system HicA family toxin [Planctomycetes bacterium]|nr:type II toxin-antitoxin system HicA family toxin [Planctomycetota bacterium]
MKRGDLIRDLVHAGCFLRRHGSRHDIYENPRNGRKAPVPRHAEIRNSLARMIRRQLDLE